MATPLPPPRCISAGPYAQTCASAASSGEFTASSASGSPPASPNCGKPLDAPTTRRGRALPPLTQRSTSSSLVTVPAAPPSPSSSSTATRLIVVAVCALAGACILGMIFVLQLATAVPAAERRLTRPSASPTGPAAVSVVIRVPPRDRRSSLPAATTATAAAAAAIVRPAPVKSRRHAGFVLEPTRTLRASLASFNVDEDTVRYIAALRGRVDEGSAAAVTTSSSGAATAPLDPTQDAIGTHLAETVFNQQRNGVFVEAYAGTGAPGSSLAASLERHYEWAGLLVEPRPGNYSVLRTQPRAIAASFHGCLSDTTEFQSHLFHSADGPLPVRVRCERACDLMLSVGLWQVDLLILSDVDGNDAKILRGIDPSLVRIRAVAIRVRASARSTAGVADRWAAIQELLHARGYRPVQPCPATVTGECPYAAYVLRTKRR